MYGLSTGTEKSRRCEEVAVSRGSTVNFTQIEGHNSAYIVQSTLSKMDAFGTGTKCPSQGDVRLIKSQTKGVKKGMKGPTLGVR